MHYPLSHRFTAAAVKDDAEGSHFFPLWQLAIYPALPYGVNLNLQHFSILQSKQP